MTITEAANALRTLGVRAPTYTIVTTATLDAHVRTLAAAHGITIHWQAARALAYPWGKRIKLPGSRIADELDYCVALHELGHAISPRQRVGRTHDNEHDAWATAETLSMIPFTADMRAHASRALGTYYKACRPYVRRKPNGVDAYRARLNRLQHPLVIESTP